MKKSKVMKIIVIIAIVLALLVSIPLVAIQVSYGLQATVLRFTCRPKNVSTPSNIDSLNQNTVIEKDISYGSTHENSNLDIIAPKNNTEKLPLFLYIHGGYYIGGDKSGATPYCQVIANEGYIVANMNYALTPEAKHPTQVLQANEALAYLTQNADKYNIDKDKIFISGDSAGCHLTAVLGTLYTNESLQKEMNIKPSITDDQLKGVALLCGYFNASKARETGFPFIGDSVWMMTDEKHYETDYARINELNPIDNVTNDFPPTYMTCGDKDPFINQNLALEDKLTSLGVSTTSFFPTTTSDPLKHEFQKNFELKEAAEAMDILLKFLKDNSK